MTTVQLYFALRREFKGFIPPNAAWRFAMLGEDFCKFLFTSAF